MADKTIPERISCLLPVVGWLAVAGIALFADSLYLLTLTGLRWLNAVVPLGGTPFIADWPRRAWQCGWV